MLTVKNVSKTYRKNGQVIRAADGLSCEVAAGDFMVVHGPSGSGKSTLLLMMGGMLPPDEGEVFFEQENVYGWSSLRRNQFRKTKVGFVFQRFFLLSYLTVYDNIRLPLKLQGKGAGAEKVIVDLAERLRIGERLNHRPGELSVGEQQRVAVARSLAAGQQLILADEPTGNLDAENIEIVTDCLQEQCRQGRSVVLVTHNQSLLSSGNQNLYIKDGRVKKNDE